MFYCRQYASMLLIAMMSLFFVCLVVDEWRDIQHAWEDLQIEAMAEIEVEDFEWDEDGRDNSDGQVHLSPALSQGEGERIIESKVYVRSNALQSKKQLIGLVRRYAPRKALISANYILTYQQMV